MNRSETAKLLGYLKFTYVNSFSKLDENEKEAMINVWAKHFQNDSFPHVMQAVENLCLTSKFVPTVADIKEEMFKVADVKQKSVGEAWELVLRSARCNMIQASNEYDKLPYNVQKALGSYTVLSEIGYSNPEALSFQRKAFEKRYEDVLATERKDLASGLLSYEEVEKNNILPKPKCKDENKIGLNIIRKLETKKMD